MHKQPVIHRESLSFICLSKEMDKVHTSHAKLNIQDYYFWLNLIKNNL